MAHKSCPGPAVDEALFRSHKHQTEPSQPTGTRQSVQEIDLQEKDSHALGIGGAAKTLLRLAFQIAPNQQKGCFQIKDAAVGGSVHMGGQPSTQTLQTCAPLFQRCNNNNLGEATGGMHH